MNERLALYIDNVEKIRLYFGQGAERLVLSMAMNLTLRNQRFYQMANRVLAMGNMPSKDKVWKTNWL